MANMQFTSQMAGDNLVGTDSRSLPTTDSGSQQSGTSQTTTDTSSRRNLHNDSPPPELNRIELPPDLASKEKERRGSKGSKGSGEDARPKAEGTQDTAKVTTAKGSSSPKEVVEATSRPLPPPPKKYPDMSHVNSDQASGSKRMALANLDKPTPPASGLGKKKKIIVGPNQDGMSTPKEPSQRLNL
ncbi:hypothetical protein OSTOST_15548, partial [Ostertagia ostertagi]